MSLRVLVVDDHPDVRSVIAALLATDGRFEVVAEAEDGAEGVRVAEREQPDIVLLDLTMPVMDGLSALPCICEAAPAAQVIVLSAFGTDRIVLSAMDQGAAAFIPKGEGLPDTLLSILDHMAGEATGSAHEKSGS